MSFAMQLRYATTVQKEFKIWRTPENGKMLGCGHPTTRKRLGRCGLCEWLAQGGRQIVPDRAARRMIITEWDARFQTPTTRSRPMDEQELRRWG